MKKLIILFIGLILLFSHVQSKKVALPVNDILLYRINFSIERLEAFMKMYNSQRMNLTALWHRIELTKRYMRQINDELKQFPTIIQGAGNSMNGANNVIIGNYNKLGGNNNWVLIQNFTGDVDGSLLVGDYIIQLNQTQFVPLQPSRCITAIKDFKNRELVNKITGSTRPLLNFDPSQNPLSANGQAWVGYEGYNEWKNKFDSNVNKDVATEILKPTPPTPTKTPIVPRIEIPQQPSTPTPTPSPQYPQFPQYPSYQPIFQPSVFPQWSYFDPNWMSKFTNPQNQNWYFF